MALSGSNLRQVVHTHVPLSPSSINCYQCKSRGVHKHTTRYTSAVSMVSQYKLVPGWRLWKRRSVPLYGPRWLGKDFTYVTVLLYDVRLSHLNEDYLLITFSLLPSIDSAVTTDWTVLQQQCSISVNVLCNCEWIHFGIQGTKYSCLRCFFCNLWWTFCNGWYCYSVYIE